MAVTLSIETSRENMFRADPFDITVREDDRGRQAAPTEEAIVQMAMSIYDYGQQQPVECRRENTVPYLVSGYTRMAAARLIREGFTGTDGKERHNPDILLKFLVVDANKEGGFKRNVIENAHRNPTSPIDDAKNHARLRDQNGMTDAEIAELYRCDTGRVSRMRRLLELPDDVQKLVHTGNLAIDAALTLLNAPAESREAIIQAATHDGEVKGSEVKAQVRAHHLRDEGEQSNGSKPAKPKVIRRSMKEVRDWLTDASIRPVGERAAVAAFTETFLEFMAGTATEEQMTAALDALA